MNTTIKSNKWMQSILQIDSDIHAAIKNLNESGIQIVLINDKSGKLVGTISDGDIRRGLLDGLELSDRVDKVMRLEPFVVNDSIPKEAAIQLMIANNIRQIPIIDSSQKVIGMHLWEEAAQVTKKDNLIVIMAGGKGTRMKPYTEKCPKPMLKVDDKPMLEHIIMRAKSQGFDKFSISINYLGSMIEDYFQDGAKFDVDINYLKEESALGTAGSLSLLNLGNNNPIIITNGDVLTDINYLDLLDFHNNHKSSGTMAVQLHEMQNPYGVVEMKGVDIVSFKEKPVTRSYINAGVYAISPSSLTLLEKQEFCDMPTLFRRIKNHKERVVAYPMHEHWLDVGRPEDLFKANNRNFFNVKGESE